MNQKTAYPLFWPTGWPRTLSRETPRFKTTLSSSLSNLKKQIELMGGKGILLSSNYTLGSENPKDPGVCVYFEFENQQLAIPCDRWIRIDANVQAIALTIEAMRGMERWGAKHMIKVMFSGFKQISNSTRPWNEVLRCAPNATAQEIKIAYREQSMKLHPDRGGTHEEMSNLNNAYDQARKAGMVE